MTKAPRPGGGAHGRQSWGSSWASWTSAGARSHQLSFLFLCPASSHTMIITSPTLCQALWSVLHDSLRPHVHTRWDPQPRWLPREALSCSRSEAGEHTARI